MVRIRTIPSYPPSKCPKHQIVRYRDNAGNPVCKICRSEANGRYSTKHNEKIKANARAVSEISYKECPEKYIWEQMIRRCHYPNHQKYSYYGGRGIKVCDRWRNSFDKFLNDMGKRPEGYDLKGRSLYSIERINNNGNYEPGNCHWATKKEQGNNTRRTHHYRSTISENALVYNLKGDLLTLKEFSEQFELPLIVVKYRYSKNWDPNWILSKSVDNRFYEYKGCNYNIVELAALSNMPYKTVYSRIVTQGWPVYKALEV